MNDPVDISDARDSIFRPVKKYINPTGERSDNFGNRVEIGRDFFFVGDPRDNVFDPSSGTDYRLAGSVYLIDRQTDAVVAVTSPQPGSEYGFGESLISIGDILVVGEPAAAVGGARRAGKVHVFDLLFREVLFSLSESPPKPESLFSRVFKADDSNIGVLAQGQTKFGNRGAVYIYGGNRNLPNFGKMIAEFKCPAANHTKDSGFSAGSACCNDELLCVGAPYSTDRSGKWGGVYVFDNNRSSSTFGQLLKHFTNPGTDNALFGLHVKLIDAVLVVSAHGETVGGMSGAGCIHVFDANRESSHFGRHLGSLEPQSPTRDMRFGWDVANSTNRIFVSALTDTKVPNGNIPSWGNVYVFEFDTTTGRLGRFLGTLAHDEDPAYFGASMDVSDASLMVGAEVGKLGGAVYLYDLTSASREAGTDDDLHPLIVSLATNFGLPPRMSTNAEDIGSDAILEKILSQPEIEWVVDSAGLELGEPPLGTSSSMRDRQNGNKVEAPAATLDDHDPEYARLSEGARELYLRANKLYRETDGRTQPFIDIYSGRRSTRDQAGLYRKYISYLYGGPKEPKANQPGKSFHEYGFAIDIVRGDDEARLASAMRFAGWRPTVEDEGWHWVAISASGFGEAERRIAEVAPISEQYGKAVSDEFSFDSHIRKYTPIYENTASTLQREFESIKQEATRVRSALSMLRREEISLRDMQSSLELRAAELNRLYDQIVKFRYTYCPNKEPYSSCVHTSEKGRYDREKRAMQLRYTAQREQFLREEARYRSQKSEWDRKKAKIEQDVDSLDARKKVYRNKQIGLVRLKERLAEWKSKMIEARGRSEELLARIISMM